MQTRLHPINITRKREDYPQIDYVDERGVQWIELNRGCKRQCVFCHADPNYKTFQIPEITSNYVQIIGEGILYDKTIDEKIKELGNKRVEGKVVYYGLSQGVDYRQLTQERCLQLSINRFGLINNKGNWNKGIRISWDWGLPQGKEVREALDMLQKVGYIPRRTMIFVLVNWRVSYQDCLQKLKKIKEWGVMIDDCTWECTKRLFIPLHWKYDDYKDFRRKCRDHNIRVNRAGFNPDDKIKKEEIGKQTILGGKK